MALILDLNTGEAICDLFSLALSLALTDSSQCGGQCIVTGTALPGGWWGSLSSQLSLWLFHWLSWAETQRGSWGRGTCQVAGKSPETLVDTQTDHELPPIKVKKTRQAFCFNPYILALPAARCPVTISFLMPGYIWCSFLIVWIWIQKENRFVVEGTQCILPWVGL